MTYLIEVKQHVVVVVSEFVISFVWLPECCPIFISSIDTVERSRHSKHKAAREFARWQRALLAITI